MRSHDATLVAAPNRRQVLGGAFSRGILGVATLALAGCETLPRFLQPAAGWPTIGERPQADIGSQNNEVPVSSYAAIYGQLEDGGFSIPAIDLAKVDPEFYRQMVTWSGPERAGTLVVDTTARHLFLVRGDGTALRYGVGVGREGFAWSGNGVIQWKQKWPKWTPPDEMIARKPELQQYSAENGGMPGGLENPLGARALYIFSGGVDTLFRIHGTPEFWSIGKAVSSGCIRMMNQDVIDLYDRIAAQTSVIVM
ncbi:MAG: L,D-transpeptidase [Nitratireductor sp.]